MGSLPDPFSNDPIPIANSEEALIRAAERQVAEGRYPDIEAAKRELRWAPTEWAFGEVFGEAFESHPSWEFTEPLLHIVETLDTSQKEGAEKFGRLFDEIDEVYYGALNFVRENARPTPQIDFKRVLLGLFQYDQGDQERLQHAKRVNPPEIFAEYEAGVMPPDLKALIDQYRRLGMPNYTDLAYIHYRGSAAVLTEAIFQREALKLVVPKGDTSFIDKARGYLRDSNPTLQEFGQAMERILQAGVNPQDINVLVREMQYTAVFVMCHMLDYPPHDLPESEQAKWRLFQVDQDMNPVKRMQGLATNMRTLFENMNRETGHEDEKT